jgi:hypothetical protein
MSEFETPLGAYLKKRHPSQISSKVVFESKGIDKKRLKVALVISEMKEIVQKTLYHCLSEYLVLGRNLFHPVLECIMSGDPPSFGGLQCSFCPPRFFCPGGENKSVSDILKEAKSLMWRPSQRFWRSI